MDSQELALLAAQAADDKKARNVVILDMRQVTLVADFFLICSGSNSIQVRAIADNIEDVLAKAGIVPHHREGYDNARWILLDYNSVVVHVFHEHERDFYNLERLWGDAPTLDALV